MNYHKKEYKINIRDWNITEYYETGGDTKPFHSVEISHAKDEEFGYALWLDYESAEKLIQFLESYVQEGRRLCLHTK